MANSIGMMSMKPFAIDIDDVTGDLATDLHLSLTRRFDGVGPVSSWSDFNLAKLFGFPYSGFLSAIIEDQILQTMKPLKGAVEAIRRIYESGHTVVLITSRGFHPEAYAVTAKWLDDHGIPYHDLIIVPPGKTKAEAAVDRYPRGFIYMVDDNADNLDHMKNAGLLSFPILIDQSWNQHRPDFKFGINRFSSMLDFVNNLQKECLREDRNTQTRELSMAV